MSWFFLLCCILHCLKSESNHVSLYWGFYLVLSRSFRPLWVLCITAKFPNRATVLKMRLKSFLVAHGNRLGEHREVVWSTEGRVYLCCNRHRVTCALEFSRTHSRASNLPRHSSGLHLAWCNMTFTQAVALQTLTSWSFSNFMDGSVFLNSERTSCTCVDLELSW